LEVIRRPRHIYSEIGKKKREKEREREHEVHCRPHIHIGNIGTVLFERIKGIRCCLEGIFTHVDSISVSCFHMVGLKRVI
jgi:hypothetical protein